MIKQVNVGHRVFCSDVITHAKEHRARTDNILNVIGDGGYELLCMFFTVTLSPYFIKSKIYLVTEKPK